MQTHEPPIPRLAKHSLRIAKVGSYSRINDRDMISLRSGILSEKNKDRNFPHLGEKPEKNNFLRGLSDPAALMTGTDAGKG